MNKPKLTVMLQARTPERIYELIEKGLAGGADGFGLQLEQLERQYHTPEIFKEILSHMNGLPAYVTNYRYAMNYGLSDESLADELVLAAECGAELIDVTGDMFCPTLDQMTYDERAIAKQEKLIEKLHSMGKRVLMSTHVCGDAMVEMIFKYIPYNEVYKIASAQKARGADVAKIVTAAQSEQELYSNFEITAKLKQELDGEYLFLCVGDYSHTHRRIAPMIAGGMLLCVAEHDELSTPAQPLLGEVKKLITAI